MTNSRTQRASNDKADAAKTTEPAAREAYVNGAETKIADANTDEGVIRLPNEGEQPRMISREDTAALGSSAPAEYTPGVANSEVDREAHERGYLGVQVDPNPDSVYTLTGQEPVRTYEELFPNDVAIVSADKLADSPQGNKEGQRSFQSGEGE